jgi:uncharacterized DUF497 family protein
LANIKNHKRDFVVAVELFNDINSKTLIDYRDYGGEIRYILLGIDNKGFLNAVIYTMRGEDIVRIISATKREMGVYYGN